MNSQKLLFVVVIKIASLLCLEDNRCIFFISVDTATCIMAR